MGARFAALLKHSIAWCVTASDFVLNNCIMSPFQRTLRIWSFPVKFDLDVRHVELPHEKALGPTHPSSPRSHQVSFDAEAGGKGDAKLEDLVGEPHDFIQQGHPSQIDMDAAGEQREIKEDAAERFSAREYPDKYKWICDYKEARNMKIELRVTADLVRDEQARLSETPVVISSGMTLICSRTGLWQASPHGTHVNPDNRRVLDPHNSDNVNEKGKTPLGKYSDGKDDEGALSKVSSTNRSTGDGKDSESSGSHGLERNGRDDSTHSKRRREDSSEHAHDVKRIKMKDEHHDRSLDIEVANAACPVERRQMPCEHTKNTTMALTPLHTIDHSPNWTPINCHCACVTTWLVSQ
ncbi:MAG: hypothetical protein Q9210_005631 [Variospora velana]